MAKKQNTPGKRSGGYLTPEELAKKYPDASFAGPQIIIGYRPNTATTDEQKALIDEFLAARADLREASFLDRMFPGQAAAIPAYRRALEREREAETALRDAGITQAMIDAHPMPEQPPES